MPRRIDVKDALYGFSYDLKRKLESDEQDPSDILDWAAIRLRRIQEQRDTGFVKSKKQLENEAKDLCESIDGRSEHRAAD